MSKAFVVLSHLEVEPNNWSTEAVKAFSTFEKAHDFAQVLKSYNKDYPNETIEIEELEYE